MHARYHIGYQLYRDLEASPCVLHVTNLDLEDVQLRTDKHDNFINP